MSRQIAILAILCIAFLVACQGAAPMPSPSPTPGVTVVIYVVATPLPTNVPFPTATVTPSPTMTRPIATSTRFKTPTRTRVPPTATKPRSTSTPAPPTAPPLAQSDTLSDGSYASTGSIRAEFSVSGGGTAATAGFFNYHCSVDNALSTYGFTDPASIAGGKFAFSALPASNGQPRVTMACSATTSTQARCTIRNLLATTRCLDTPVIVNRK